MNTSPHNLSKREPRRKIAYILKMFPRFSETFILNEILELERRGVPLHLFSIKTPKERLRHRRAERVHGKLTYVPEPVGTSAIEVLKRFYTMWPVLAANLALFRRQPERYGRALSACLASASANPRRGGPEDSSSLVVYRNILAAFINRASSKRVRKARKRFLSAGYIAKFLLEEHVTHIHAHFANDPATVAHLANLLTGIPYSFTAHAKDIFLSEPASLQEKVDSAKFVVTCTEYNREYLSKISTNGTPIRTIYHGVDPDVFDMSPNAQGHVTPIVSDWPLILSVGRLVEKKGLSSLIDACDLLRRWHVRFRCQIVGEGPLETGLREQIGELRLEKRVELLPFLPQERLASKYTEATVFALPCRITENGDRDGIPNVLLEAMWLGIPVVSTAVSGISELINPGEDGVLVEPGKPTALAAHLRDVLLRPATYRPMGLRGRDKVRRDFELRRNVGRLAILLESA